MTHREEIELSKSGLTTKQIENLNNADRSLETMSKMTKEQQDKRRLQPHRIRRYARPSYEHGKHIVVNG